MEVVAGVLEKDGRILICQRKPGGRHAFKWEFPGGKVEPGETPEAALARELGEELGIQAVIGSHIHTETVQYGNGLAIHLQFFQVTEFSPDPVNLDFAQMVWENRDQLGAYDFLDGDVAFIKKLVNQTPDSQ
jgi:8-oxo-dGTP diphosphatase